ncbi:hypothetical protein [Chromohalobacter israelensis]|uniref:hypothetical protein n=1 Tax=Chromohalobacter israelensis TaxID=141390 RepID=UPI0015F2D04C|nr:hypothetical protein [Chromohalobacter israelensis]MDF9435124.1 hypothetical protein [Chromohalobacter israelensis]
MLVMVKAKSIAGAFSFLTSMDSTIAEDIMPTTMPSPSSVIISMKLNRKELWCCAKRLCMVPFIPAKQLVVLTINDSIKKSEKHIAESIKKDLGDLDELPDTAIVFFILKLRLEVSRGFISIMLREA